MLRFLVVAVVAVVVLGFCVACGFFLVADFVELEDALSSLLKGMNIGFRFLDNSILLYNKNEQKKEDTSSDKKKGLKTYDQMCTFG